MIPNILKPDNYNRNQINSVLSAGGLVFVKTKLSFDFPKAVKYQMMSNRALTFVYLRQTNMIPNMLTPDNHNLNQINSVLSAGGLVFEITKLSFNFPK